MKNKTLCIIALGVALCTIPFAKVGAQENPNVVKLNLLPLTTGTIAVEYERALTDRFTAGAMFSFRGGNSKLPFSSTINSFVDDEDAKNILEKTTLGATSFAVEGRYYTGKKGAFRGFYLAPYLKYANYAVGTPIPVDIDPPTGSGYEKIEEVMAKGNLSALTVGLGVGVQFKLAKNVALDWRIIGPGYGSGSGTLSGTPDRELTPDEQQEIREQIDDLDEIPFVKIVSKDVDANGIKFKTKSPWGGIRTALSIGYRF